VGDVIFSLPKSLLSEIEHWLLSWALVVNIARRECMSRLKDLEDGRDEEEIIEEVGKIEVSASNIIENMKWAVEEKIKGALKKYGFSPLGDIFVLVDVDGLFDGNWEYKIYTYRICSVRVVDERKVDVLAEFVEKKVVYEDGFEYDFELSSMKLSMDYIPDPEKAPISHALTELLDKRRVIPYLYPHEENDRVFLLLVRDVVKSERSGKREELKRALDRLIEQYPHLYFENEEIIKALKEIREKIDT